MSKHTEIRIRFAAAVPPLAFNPCSFILNILPAVDTGDNAVRKIVIATGEVSPFAGGTSGSANGIGSSASFIQPGGIWGDGVELPVADTQNHTIRHIDLSTRAVSTYAGAAGILGADDSGSPDLGTRFNAPWGLWGDGSSYLYVIDTFNNSIRQIYQITND